MDGRKQRAAMMAGRALWAAASESGKPMSCWFTACHSEGSNIVASIKPNAASTIGTKKRKK